jgi:hypothetical protein
VCLSLVTALGFLLAPQVKAETNTNFNEGEQEALCRKGFFANKTNMGNYTTNLVKKIKAQVKRKLMLRFRKAKGLVVKASASDNTTISLYVKVSKGVSQYSNKYYINEAFNLKFSYVSNASGDFKEKNGKYTCIADLDTSDTLRVKYTGSTYIYNEEWFSVKIPSQKFKIDAQTI